MKLTHLLLLVSVTCLAPLAASAQWQWIDKDGKRVFSDRAPGADIPAKDILRRPGGARVANTEPAAAAATPSGTAAPAPQASASSPKVSKVDKDLEAKKKQGDAAEEAKKKAEEERVAKAKVENCAQAKQSKASLDSGIRTFRVNAQGEREVMDESARAAEMARLQAVMSSDCK